ncbi:hypothetical protein LCGC14_0781500 [marine sediment metagenome]|uniref:ATP-dependent DNA ligase family profile domain-containing protein n=1 Tax=marine sediment metagenome TaxID=412755 RepID=A0A0F9T2F3_9ZZZZ
MKNREFLMLAKVFDPKKHGIGGWFLSEKLDGQRAFWDGGISRGLLKREVPWANTNKDSRYRVEQISTGLWSRLGNVIHAPDWWLNELPCVMLDGELWHGVRGHGQRQILTRMIKTLVPGPDWKKVKFYVFDMPSPLAIFRDGRLNNPNFKKIFEGIRDWKYGNEIILDWEPCGLTHFERSVREMGKRLTGNVAIFHPQEQLPFQTSKALEIIQNKLTIVCNLNGEGLMLRKPESWWEPKRVATILKVKKLDDDEGIVTGYVTGRKTDKGSKLLGLMGALILDYNGKRLELSGFTDAERQLSPVDLHPDKDAFIWAAEHPGQEVPDRISSVKFPRGSAVTFRHRGFSLDGIPTEARYWRQEKV